ncbi:MAG: phosphopyruvate hydratase [Geminicoccaceae bacterium]|nr:phosphopyruvate hydratase [Geminicoccaceae bacterium]MCS7267412.1 phosphopyruvate hydratase [Geminicoccaceae bacterium]MDW8125651.1 phosphopyruvate hydratase [Geminicoccaceae bacterium]MDW8339975.1 phosphopyruvate hydratase [Geminicoccaceae bacterium]
MSRTTIVAVRGRRVWDSRARPTVEAEVELACGVVGRGIAPAGASTGSGEALDRRDGGPRLGGFDVRGAVAAVNGEIARALSGCEATDQEAVDRRLVELDGTPDKSRLGANALLAVSIATANAAAAAHGLPLWRWLGGTEARGLPLPEIQILGGGRHAHGRIDIQDVLVVCPGARSFAQALEWTAEVYRSAGELLAEAGKLRGVADEGGFFPEVANNEEAIALVARAIERAGLRAGEEVAIALDIAASSFGREGRYRLSAEGRELDTEAMIELLAAWIARYPIVSIEDPLAEDDLDGFSAFTARFGERIQIVGDDLLVTSATRIERAAFEGWCTAVLLKPNQVGTLSETGAAWRAARDGGLGGIVSARSGESEDTTIVHLCVGWGVPQLKVGAMARGERTAKWNEALRIEETLGPRARFSGGAALRRPVRGDDAGVLRSPGALATVLPKDRARSEKTEAS